MGNVKKENILTTLAIYDFDSKQIDCKALFCFFEEWINSLGLKPERGSVTLDDRGSKTSSFQAAKKKITKVDNSDSVSAMWMGAYKSEPSDDTLDITLGASFIRGDRNVVYLTFVSDIVDDDLVYADKVSVELSQFISSKYGIVYHRDRSKGPTYYCLGMIMGVNGDEAEGKKIAQWFRKYYFKNGPYKTGDLRDIYPVNFISKEHLSRVVFCQTLEEWVQSSETHGILEPFTDQLWKWTIPNEKIDKVREALKDTGIIICV